ncbi:MAG TPA: hypothetical protein VEB21_06025, partial [Terriglobales bacterium]|nr:hypothetical protein [Terriglobales bacterium]
GRPCWKAVGSRAYKYRRRNGNQAGVTQVVLKSGDRDAAIHVKGKGAGLQLPLPLEAAGEVKVQLIRSDSSLCWESRFAVPADRSSETLYSDRVR